MKIQEKLQASVNEIVKNAQEGFSTVKDQFNGVAQELTEAGKKELNAQKEAFEGYKERFNTLKDKGLNRAEIINTLKEESSFFGNEVTTTIRRNVNTLKSILNPKVSEVKNTFAKFTSKAEKAGKEATKNVKNATKTTKTKATKAAKKVEDKVEEVVAE
ncbi:MAG: hypothetical protein M9887_05680 [Chitinophagales bacterium]|nr:hypothetical protein [Chitinophagales bacterium]